MFPKKKKKKKNKNTNNIIISQNWTSVLTKKQITILTLE